MKKIMGAIFVTGFLLAATAFAQTGMMGGQSGVMGYGQNASSTAQVGDNTAINSVLQDIYKSQNVSNQNQIDCAKVTDSQFEKLGDAYMGYGTTEQQHTAMENMMGGEGSATLTQAHINMGRSYVGCWANYKGAPSMMGSSIMGGFGQYSPAYPSTRGLMGWSNSMQGYYGGYLWFHWITMILVWILLISGIMALVKWLQKK